MNRTVWLHRLCALAAFVGLGLAVSGVLGIADDLTDARNARTATPATRPAPAASATGWSAPRPALIIERGDAEARLVEFFNGQLGDLGLLTTSIDTTSLRPIGDELKLAEVTIRAKGKLEAVADVASWIAVNREALRLKSITVSPTDQGEAQLALVVLTVIA